MESTAPTIYEVVESIVSSVSRHMLSQIAREALDVRLELEPLNC